VGSGVTQGLLIKRVDPIYPTIAAINRVQGVVLLGATISKEGTIKDLQVISGNPLLNGAAIDAVKQWRYRPYVMNGEPVEVDTQIIVNFTLQQR
jgi:protein TonB